MSQPESLPRLSESAQCGRLMVGSGTDTYDPICELAAGHRGCCMSTAAIDQYRLPEEARNA